MEKDLYSRKHHKKRRYLRAHKPQPEANPWTEKTTAFGALQRKIYVIRNFGDGRVPMEMHREFARLDHELTQGMEGWNSRCGFKIGDSLESHPLFKPPQPEATSTPPKAG